MATAGLDGLLEFLLSEIAVCGVQGANSKDFCRFVDTYFQDERRKEADASDQPDRKASLRLLNRNFYEKAWDWVTTHSDIRIFDGNKLFNLSLSEMESLERRAADIQHNEFAVATQQEYAVGTPWPPTQHFRASSALSSLGRSLRERLLAEYGEAAPKSPADSSPAISSRTTQHATTSSVATGADDQATSPDFGSNTANNISILADTTIDIEELQNLRRPRKALKDVKVAEAKFDELPSLIKSPRIFASQNRVWQAIAGHSIDHKKIPALEFVCLCVIATHGHGGIAQPELVKITGQDKRSVPKRTDDLARKGYIEKKPIYTVKMRTSLCVHKKFVKGSNYLTRPRGIDDVFGEQKFIPSGFVFLLHKLLAESPVVPMRDLRKRMGVPAKIWNGRGARGVIVRLEQTEMVKRVLAPRRGSKRMLVCVKFLRDPSEDDLNNLKFKRVVPERERVEEPLEEDAPGDGFDRDLELSLLEGVDSESDDDVDDDYRIPPQWTPDRLLPNLMFEAAESFGVDGQDTAELRDVTLGKFWKRPLESFVSRLVDDWERSQPPHLRHLAIVKDTTVTNNKKFSHYIYRTYKRFQSAVDTGEAKWESVSREALAKRQPNKKSGTDVSLDSWGFAPVDVKEFLRQNGTSTLTECRKAILHRRKTGTHWDNALWDRIGNKPERPVKDKKPALITVTSRGSIRSSAAPTPLFTKKNIPSAAPSFLVGEDPEHFAELTLDDRSAEEGIQSRGQRQGTSQSCAVPNKCIEKPSKDVNFRREGCTLTKEERIARGLPLRGRLSKAMENQIRREKGMSVKPTKAKIPRVRRLPGEGPLLTPDQRKAKGLSAHGRLPEKVVAELRRLKGLGLDPFSIVLPLPNDDTARESVAGSECGSIGETSTSHEQCTATEQPYERQAEPLPSSPHLVVASTSAASTDLDESRKRIADPLSEESQKTSKRRRISVGPQLSPAFERVRRSNAGFAKAEEQALASPHSTITQTPRRIGRANTDMTAPGFYYDAKATRSINGRGRPRKAFIGIVKTEGLHDFSWFNSDSNSTAMIRFSQSSVITALAQQAKSTNTSDGIPELVNGSIVDEDLHERSGLQLDASVNVVDLSRDEASRKLSLVPVIGKSGTPPEIRPKTGEEQISVLSPRASAIPEPKETTSLASGMPLQESSGAVPQESEEIAEEDASTKPPQAPSEMRIHHLVGNQTPERLPGVPVESLPNSLQGSILPKAVWELIPRDRQQHTVPNSYANPQSPIPSPNEDVVMIDTQADEQQVVQAVEECIVSPAPLPNDEATAIDTQPYEIASIQDDDEHRLPQECSATMHRLALAQPDGYQSPYASNSTPMFAALVEVEQVEPSAATNVSVFEPEPSQRTPERHGKRGVVIGRGSAYRTRTSIIRHILELCNGVFPHNSEIFYVFNELWKEYAPKKMACPERSTITSTLNSMINDPDQNLRKYNFDFMTNGGKTANKAIFANKDLAFNSAEVQRVFHGIRQAHPNKYFPPEISNYVREEPKNSRFAPVTEVDEHANLPDTMTMAAKQLARRIRDGAKRRDNDAEQRSQESLKERQEKDNAVQQKQPRARTNRARLVGLNVTSLPKLLHTVPYVPGVAHSTRPAVFPTNKLSEPSERSSQSSDSSDDIPLAQLAQQQSHISSGTSPGDISSSPASYLTDDSDPPVFEDMCRMFNVGPISLEQLSQETQSRDVLTSHHYALIKPATSFYPASGTFSTDYKPKRRPRGPDSYPRTRTAKSAVAGLYNAFIRPAVCFYPTSGTFCTEFSIGPAMLKKGRKRARLLVSVSERPTKRARIASWSEPTLVQRLTGLTGNANEPDYKPPTKKQKTYPTWEERRGKRRNRIYEVKDRKYEEILDPVDRFKKLLCALVVASSMSCDDGTVDWNIVKTSYSNRHPDLSKMKRVWSWIQENMATQLNTFTDNFQSAFLKAYEEGKIASIEDPATYDWANLVRWATMHCEYTGPILPETRNGLELYDVDISDYQIFNRPHWYKNYIASIGRSQNLHDYAFAAPLHSAVKETAATEKENIRARSWIRANISTPNDLYNKNMAHDKLRPLGTSILERAVGDLVDANFIRRWKLKRLRPGRNYDFTNKFAMKYRRTFELSDFMSAVKLKKVLDLTFAANKSFTISRTADDGAVMALISLVSDGQVKLVPNLPPTNNALKAPQPRISVWGFNEGDYVHRKINRNHMFWQVDAIPTKTYTYGNPLQPSPFPRPAKSDGTPADWDILPAPPLPSHDNPDAPLPIWSTIDGQHAIYGWWYRILNIVIQSLMFQPSSTTSDLYSHCPEHTAELFEVELVLHWLEKVNAIQQTSRGTYQVSSGFWAVFGDKIIDEENDKFGEHVKRKNKSNKLEPTWRTEYNQMFAALQQEEVAALDPGIASSDDELLAHEDDDPVVQQILNNSKAQYALARKALQKSRKPGRPRKVTLPNPPIGHALTASHPDQDENRDVIMIDPALNGSNQVAATAPTDATGAPPTPQPGRKRKRATCENGVAPPKPAKQRKAAAATSNTTNERKATVANGTPKKKRGRPKKIRPSGNPELHDDGEDVDAEGEPDEDYTRPLREAAGVA